MVIATQAIAPDDAVKGTSLQISRVSHSYGEGGDRVDVLENVTFGVDAGEFVALLGPSGCGKSTLLRLAAGLEQPTMGKIGVDMVRVTGPDPSRLLVFQDPTLFPWRTVRGNVALGLEARGVQGDHRGQVDAALDLVGLTAFAEARPHELSGGMAQRAALARVLVNQPSLLLLDEPFGKLDALTRMTLQGELLRLWQSGGFTTILVTHDVEEALLLAQRVIVFGPRPARIELEVEIDLAYPRHRDTRRFIELRRSILAALGHGEDI